MQSNAIAEYYQAIMDGSIITSKRVKKVYAQLMDIVNGKSDKYEYDNSKATHVIQFIERFCKHSKGEWAGSLVTLELFQKAYLSALFGIIRRDNGLRRFRETLLMVGRKNGKSTLLSALALYMLVADGEAGAEIYSVATKKDQAKLVFDETLRMVQQSKEFSQLIKKRKTDLFFGATYSKFEPLSSDSNTLDGLNSQLIIIDELHAVKDRNLYEVMKQSMSSRTQPLLVMITTAGTLRDNIFDDIYSYACRVIDGEITDETFLPVIYELDKKEEWTDSKYWQKANPALGSIKKLEYLSDLVERAKQNPVDLKGLLVKDFNIRDNANSRWLTFDEIKNAQIHDISTFQNYYAIGGADLSRTTDLTCATILLIDPHTEKRYVQQMYFLPEEGFHERVRSENIPYDIWLDQGYLRLCEGNKINYSDVTNWFNEVVQNWKINILYVYYDSWGSVYWTQEMESYGYRMIPCHQGTKTLSIPMQNLGADLKAKKVNYNDNPMLEWCLNNTTIIVDTNGNIKPFKGSSEKYRIDGTASLLNCYVGLEENYMEMIQAQPRERREHE